MKTLHRSFAPLAAVAAAALLAACGTTTDLSEKKPAAPVETRAASPAPAAAPSPAATPAPAAPQSRVATVDLAKDPALEAAARAPRIVYFDFDSFVIKDEFKPLLETHAKALAAQKQRRIKVEGHTDERGGSEYNLALGQKRAEAVARSLALLGVADTQVEAVSFGKERPVDTGHDEAAWAKNRRAELKDR